MSRIKHAIRLALFGCALSAGTQAQIVTDGTMGAAQSLEGPDFEIGQDLGTRAGDNLFHSFTAFSIASGESATFTGAADILNVISRVTGPDASFIYGTLRSEVGQADLWLLNPNGVLFGEGAELDIPGTLLVGTADQLKFADGFELGTLPVVPSTLSIEPPQEFGFLDSNQAVLRFENNDFSIVGTGLYARSRQIETDDTQFTLEGRPAGFLHFEGGRLELKDTRILSEHKGEFDSTTGILLEGGTIDMQGAQIQTEVHGSGVGPVVDLVATGDIRMSDTSRIDAYGYDAGDSGGIHINGNNLVMKDQNSGIGSYRVEGSGGSEDIIIQLKGDMTVSGSIEINSDTYSEGDAGDVIIKATNLTMGEEVSETHDRVMITSDTVDAPGDGGGVYVELTGTLTVHPNSVLASSTFGPGDGGQVVVKAANVMINGLGSTQYTGISSSGLFGSGDAGSVQIDVTEALRMKGGAISSDSETEGDAGLILIKADQLVMSGSEGNEATISSDSKSVEANAGDAGLIEIQARDISLEGDSSIATNSEGSGFAGTLLLKGTNLTLDGAGSLVSLSSGAKSTGDAGDVDLRFSGDVKLLNNAVVSSDTKGQGEGGWIRIEAKNLLLNGGTERADISSGSYDDSEQAGDAGFIELRVAGLLEMLNSAKIESDTEGGGYAGYIDIEAGEMNMAAVDDTTEITSDTKGSGSAGEIRIQAGNLTLSGDGGSAHISSDARAGASGTAGSISIAVPGQIELKDNAFVSSVTQSSGDGGLVSIEGGSLYVHGDDSSRGINTSSTSTDPAHQASAGNLNIKLSDDLTLLDGSRLNSDSFGRGYAGDIVILARNLRIAGAFEDGSSIQSDSRSAGDGGLVEIVLTDDLTMDPYAEITTDAYGSGLAGNILLDVGGDIRLDGHTRITSDTAGRGNAGNITIQASSLHLDGEESDAFVTSSTTARGDAGEISIKLSDSLQVRSGGIIATSSFHAGEAGQVTLRAPFIELNGENQNLITAIASAASGPDHQQAGGVGTIYLIADELIVKNGAQLSIESSNSSFSSGADQFLEIEAGTMLVDDASINAQADGDTESANIVIKIQSELDVVNNSSITTASGDANAGFIELFANRLRLESSQITTSVSGDQGNGGDIYLESKGMILDKGFIQANTSAEGATGGNITVETPYLLVPGNQDFIAGGNERQEFNPDAEISVIQAAAPDGVSGQVELEIPEVDLAAAILSVDSGFAQLAEIDPNPCSGSDRESPGSLTLASRGALPTDPALAPGSSLPPCSAADAEASN